MKPSSIESSQQNSSRLLEKVDAQQKNYRYTMIEIQNIQKIGKGSLLALCDVHIIPWKMTLHEVKIFEKGANRWISLPAREYVNPMGEKKYIDLISFDNEATKNRFKDQIMPAIDKFLLDNPEMKPEDIIKESDEVPF